MSGTRKLKCSGEKPKCSRCNREKVECIFSPQKPMGRPRKRRREGEAEAKDNAMLPREGDGDTINFTELPLYSDQGLITPPQFGDIGLTNESFIDENETSIQHDVEDSNGFSLSPSSGLKYVFI